MRLFSEKVSPTFTSSDLNILTVKEFQEVFFDVFEFEINGKKFVAEKISEYKESPVVSIPLVLEGKELTAPFVLQRGEFEILFNKNNSTFVRESEDTSEELVIEYTNRDEEVEELIFEKKEDILKEIAQARQSAERYVEKLKQQKIDEAAEYFNEKKKSIDAEIAESKKGLLNEFLSLVENVKSEFYDFNEYEREKFSAFVERTISELTEQLTESLDKKQNKAEEKFSEQINELATNILANVLLKEIEANNNKSSRRIDEGLELISSSVKKIVKDSNYDLTRDVNNKLNSFNDSILNLEKINIELNDLINKGDNRALSRIGNIKTQLEESINSTSTTLSERIDNTQQEIKSLHSSSSLLEESILNNTTSLISRIDEAESRITTFYNDKISLIEEKVNDLSEDNKQYFLNLINESKISLLNEIANIKVDVPNIVIEKSNGKQEVDLKGIKSELEKIIGTRFSNELQSLKRLIEMSSGGGSVAKQFAAGGTMEGTLNVTGQYLSAGVDLLTLFSSGGGGGDENVNTLVRSNSAYWDEAYNTSVVYQSNSALYATVDYTNSKFFPLTGGTVTGDTRFNSNVTIFGNLTTTGTTTFANTVFSVTSALSVVHIGAGPAVWVGNNGSGDIASFYDIDENIEVLHVGGINSANPNVGIKTSTPNKTFTVVGEISSTSDITTSGSIGIGTSIPNEKLTVSGNISATGSVSVSGVTIGNESAISSPTIEHIVSLTQAEYDSLTPESNTFYIITDAEAYGPVSFPIKSVNGDYSVLETDYTLKTVMSATLTLPTAIGCSGRLYNFKNWIVGGTTMIVAAASGETIDNASTFISTTRYESITIQSDGTGWIIL